MTSSEALDHGLCQEMAKYVEELTHSGQMKLDEGLMKSFKRICRKGDVYVKHAYYLCLTELQKDHSEIRLSAFQMISELFERSHCFRELLLTDFNEFLELTAEINNDNPLPPPKPVARSLKQKAIQAIQKWQDTFGSTYKRLKLGYNYLRNCKKVEFEAIRVRTNAERIREEADQIKRLRVQTLLLEKIENEIQEQKTDMLDCLKQTDGCIELISPDPDFQIDWDKILRPTTQQQTTSVTDDDENNSKNAESITRNIPESNKHQDVNSWVAAATSSSRCKLSLDNLLLPGEGEEFPAAQQTTTVTNGDNDGFKKPFDIDHPESRIGVPRIADDDEDSDSDHSDLESVPDLSVDGASEISRSDSEYLRTHGLGSWRYSLDIHVSRQIAETNDNKVLIDNLKDFFKISARYVTVCSKWLERLSKIGASQTVVKEIIDLKYKFEINQKKIEKITGKIVLTPHQTGSGAERVKRPLVTESSNGKSSSEWTINNNSKRIDEELQDPTSAVPNIRAILDRNKSSNSPSTSSTKTATSPAPVGKTTSPQPSTSSSRVAPQPSTSTSCSDPPMNSTTDPATSSRRDELLKIAPVVPFDMDLHYWGEDVAPPSLIKYDSLHRFWTPIENEEFVSPQTMESLTSRKMHFCPIEPIKWKCRAPMPNGKLCERMDRVKCPFHGKIIPRDEQGKPADPKQLPTKTKGKQKDREELPAWEDPELLRDIEAAKGLKLFPTKKKGKKKKGKHEDHSGLTDIKKRQNTTRTRLATRIFNKAVQKRVNSAMDSIDSKRVNDRFSNQFNYAFKP
ncbi:UV-stimulated scaffold protein A-like [Tubulanus polymorphus]|uniref:UV-stimulated scaffold protein A-like n=1 Tax=Tubulanus polymorphus TaxID=672921 RepID=UPI003DA33EE2